MKLKTYIKELGIKPSFLAKKIGISYQTLHNIVNEKVIPSLLVALKIEKETNGMVKCEDLVPEADSQTQNRES